MYTYEEEDTRFYIDQSTLPNAGYGCFAKEFIKKSDWLEVSGVYVKTGSIADECTHYAMRYKFAGSPELNAKIIPMGFAGLVNHTDDPNLQNCQLEFSKSLVKRSDHSGQVVYKFIRDVMPGEEILGNYGPNVGGEVKKLSENMGFVDENERNWQDFLKFDLYGLKKLEELL